MGFDVHAFEPGDHVWIGGVRIPHDRALKGHSDADVGLHALTDALLGAIAAGDIGDILRPATRSGKERPPPSSSNMRGRWSSNEAGGSIMSTSRSSAKRRASGRTGKPCGRASLSCCG
jgi:2-C-methyl-D-erythritol 4-phosphate cytidylyltransferase/2-C-methyl-D-erythritol 2,4-cyclodiphosphate synthase